MKEIFDFIEDACSALDLLSRYYRISYDKSKEVYSEDGLMIGDGMTEELGWVDGDIYGMVAKEDGSRYTFNDACEFLTDKYEESPDIFSEENGHDGDYFVSLLESQFLNIDEIQRIALIKKIIRSSFNFLMPNSYPLYEAIQSDNTYGIFAYRNFMSDEEIEDYEQKDEMGMHKAFPIVAWIIDECCKFLYGVGTLCSDYNIDLQSVVEAVFHSTSTTMPLRLDIFGDSIKSEKNNEYLHKKEEKIILKWEGQSNVLTDMLRQAKNRGYLVNSIPDIAIFLKENFSCFAKTKLSTIETQLKNNNSSANAFPKEEKRIKIDN